MEGPSIRLVPVSSLPALSIEQRAEILDVLFERSPQLHTLSVPDLGEKTFFSYTEVIANVRNQLLELYQSNEENDKKLLEAILSAHPRLGEKKVDSAMSRQEQSGLKDENAAESEKLIELNAKYEETFPGLRYVTFVNNRPRPLIMEDMQKRIDTSTLEQEKNDAIVAMCDIAVDRVKKLGAA